MEERIQGDLQGIGARVAYAIGYRLPLIFIAALAGWWIGGK